MITTIVSFLKKYPLVALFFISVFVLHLLIILPSGTYWCFQDRGCGIAFWGSHEHDGVWHLALAKNAFNSWPFVLPNMTGTMLAGYNFFLDFILFLFWKIGIDPLITYFKLFPVLWATLYGGILILFGQKRQKGWLYTTLLFTFTLLGGSFGYILTLYRKQTLIGSAVNTAMQPIQTLTNLQFAFSLVLILASFYILSHKELKIKKYLYLCFFLFMTLGLKFYGGLILLVILISFTALRGKMNSLLFMGMLALTSVVGLFVFYNPLQSLQSGSSLVFKPFSLVNPMIEDPSLYYMKNLTLARYFLEEGGKFSPRLIGIYIFSLLLFYVHNFGTRIFGIFYFKIKSLQRKVTILEVSIFSGVVAAFLMTVLFVQKGEWWNTIQFMYYAFFLSAIFLADFVYALFVQKKIVSTLLAIIIICASLPINYDFLQFSFSKPSSFISQDELSALAYLKSQPKGTVFTAPFNKLSPHVGTNPFPLWVSADTTYVAAFSEKPLYVADLVQLRLIGAPYLKRLNNAEKYSCSVLAEITYVYEIKEQGIQKKFKKCGTKLKKIYSNKTVSIYQKRQSAPNSL